MKREATSPLDVAHLIADLRYEQSLTQGELADAIGLARTSVTNIEQGRQRISVENMFAIFDALGYVPVIKVKRKGQ
jgi:transcriptional regulator with XRE-family HTH domain